MFAPGFVDDANVNDILIIDATFQKTMGKLLPITIQELWREIMFGIVWSSKCDLHPSTYAFEKVLGGWIAFRNFLPPDWMFYSQCGVILFTGNSGLQQPPIRSDLVPRGETTRDTNKKERKKESNHTASCCCCIHKDPCNIHVSISSLLLYTYTLTGTLVSLRGRSIPSSTY